MYGGSHLGDVARVLGTGSAENPVSGARASGCDAAEAASGSIDGATASMARTVEAASNGPSSSAFAEVGSMAPVDAVKGGSSLRSRATGAPAQRALQANKMAAPSPTRIAAAVAVGRRDPWARSLRPVRPQFASLLIAGGAGSDLAIGGAGDEGLCCLFVTGPSFAEGSTEGRRTTSSAARASKAPTDPWATCVVPIGVAVSRGAVAEAYGVSAATSSRTEPKRFSRSF